MLIHGFPLQERVHLPISLRLCVFRAAAAWRSPAPPLVELSFLHKKIPSARLAPSSFHEKGLLMKKNPSITPAPHFLRGLCAALIIIIISAIAYHGIRQLYFVGSDFKYLSYGKNVDLLTLLRHFIPHEGSRGHIYLTLWIWRLDYLLWGLEPKGYLLQAFFIHCSSAFLMYLLCRTAGGRWRQSLMAGLIFALFPLNAEAVCYPSASGYIFSTLFYLGSILAYIRWRTVSATLKMYILSLVLEVLALLAFGAAVTLPFMIWMLDAVLLGRGDRGSFILRNMRRIKRCAPHFLILLAYFGFSYSFGLNMSYPVGIVFKASTIMKQLLIDIPLVFCLPLKQTLLLAGGANLFLLPLHTKLLALASVAALGLLLFRINRPLPWQHIGAGILWIAICVLPFWRALWNLEWDFLSSRHLYLASCGWALFLAALVAGGHGRRRAIAIWLAVLIILFYLFLTTRYVKDWERGTAVSRGVITGLKLQVPKPEGKKIFLMNIPWLYNGVPLLWNPIDVMMALSPDLPYSVYRKIGMWRPGSDNLVWEVFPFKVFILNRSWRLTYFRNEVEKPPRLDLESLRNLQYGSRDLFFIWDGERRELRDVTGEIERAATEGKLPPPFDIYLKSTIWSSPPGTTPIPREEQMAI